MTELMVTVAVLAILVAVAAPSFSNLLNSNRLTTAANEVVAGLQLARMEAIRRNSAVSICPSTDGTSCSGGDWQRFIVFPDPDADGTVDDGETVVRDVTLSAGSININASGNVASNNRIRFGANGFATVGSGVARSGSISVCSTDLPVAENTRDISIDVSRISVATRNGTQACSADQD